MGCLPRYLASRFAELSSARAGLRPGSARAEIETEKFLDRWSPKSDRYHYERVHLYRKRSDIIARRLRRQAYRRTYILESRQSSDNEDISWPTVLSDSFYDDNAETPRTDCSQSSFVFSDLGSTFQDELDEYDEQIKDLQDQSPAPPCPQTPTLYAKHPTTPRKSDRIHGAESYKIGTIFSTPHHTAFSSQQWVSASDPHQTPTAFGVVYSKFRKMIVIKKFGQHCICVPIYTHNGRGLEGKQFITEYVSIRDAADRCPEPPQGLHLKLLAVGNPDFRGKIVAGKSSVKLTEYFSHRFNAPATMEGELDTRSLSTKRLLALVRVLGG